MKARHACFAMLLLSYHAMAGNASGWLDEGRALHAAGRVAEALEKYESVASPQSDATNTERGTAHNNACVALTDEGSYRAALDHCLRARDYREADNAPARLARTLNNLGLVRQHLGQYDLAQAAYAAALAINTSADDVASQALNHTNLGMLNTRTGKYADAMAHFAHAERLSDEHEGAPWAARQGTLARINRGVLLEKLGAYSEALTQYQFASEDVSLDASQRALLDVNIGVAYRNLGDPVSARAAFQTAVDRFRALDNSAALANAWLNIALVEHFNLAHSDAALAAVTTALALARKSADRNEEMQSLFVLGRIHLDQGDFGAALLAFSECLESATLAGSPEGTWSALEGLGLVAARQGDDEEAVKRFQQAIGEIEILRENIGHAQHRQEYFGAQRPVFSAMIAALWRLHSADPAAGHGQRAFAVAQQGRARELVEALGPDAFTAGPSTAGEVLADLGDSALMEFYLGDTYLYLWVLHRGSVRFERAGDSLRVAHSVRAAHAALAAGREPDATVLKELSETLAGPVPVDAGVLRIVPDGVLNYLPFEMLRRADNQLLLDTASVSYLPSASALHWLTSRADARLAWLAFGDAVLPRDAAPGTRAAFAGGIALEALTSTRADLAGLDQWLPGDHSVYLGADATEARLRTTATAGARVLHIASHSVIDERPGRGAAILLTPAGDDDGFLQPEELAAMHLNVNLTVLAACRTALGGPEDGRAMNSLTGAVLAAGSPAVLATLWDVGDHTTTAFMQQFYFQLGQGLSAADALRAAKRRLRDSPGWDAPSRWAAYVLVGNSRPVTDTKGAQAGLPNWRWLALAVALLVIALVVRARAPSRRE